MERFREIYEKYRKEYDDELEKSPEEIENEIILTQYPNFKKTKVAVLFAKKIYFIAKLKMRAKKAEKRLNKRKMKILELIDGEKNYIKKLEVYIDHVKRPIEKLNVLS